MFVSGMVQQPAGEKSEGTFLNPCRRHVAGVLKESPIELPRLRLRRLGLDAATLISLSMRECVLCDTISMHFTPSSGTWT